MKGKESEGEIRLVKPQDLQQAIQLEEEGYPADEAASYSSIIFRQKRASELFLGYFEGYNLIGFIMATRSHGEHLTEESMSTHIGDGDAVCIHSVCVSKDRRRQGIASRLLREYAAHVRRTQLGVRRVLLICRPELIPLYTRAGFVYVDKSAVVHGQRPWFEMVMNID